jgi:hypothetical protein
LAGKAGRDIGPLDHEEMMSDLLDVIQLETEELEEKEPPGPEKDRDRRWWTLGDCK